MVEERVAKWRERLSEEKKSLSSGNLDERLIYYADFYDLETIKKKSWDDELKKSFRGTKRNIIIPANFRKVQESRGA